MGLIKAAFAATGGTLADQWKEFFYCDALDSDVLAAKGKKRTSSRSSNTKGDDNVISSGSGIAVADGQCMICLLYTSIVTIGEKELESGLLSVRSSKEGDLGQIPTDELIEMLKEEIKTKKC